MAARTKFQGLQRLPHNSWTTTPQILWGSRRSERDPLVNGQRHIGQTSRPSPRSRLVTARLTSSKRFKKIEITKLRLSLILF